MMQFCVPKYFRVKRLIYLNASINFNMLTLPLAREIASLFNQRMNMNVIFQNGICAPKDRVILYKSTVFFVSVSSSRRVVPEIYSTIRNSGRSVVFSVEEVCFRRCQCLFAESGYNS